MTSNSKAWTCCAALSKSLVPILMAREMFVAADSETTHCSTILLYQSLQEQARKGNKEAKATTTTSPVPLRIWGLALAFETANALVPKIISIGSLPHFQGMT